MKSNLEIIYYVVERVESDLSENISLDSLAIESGYSKYHLHKMFTNIVGLSLHQYIKGRRLSVAATNLISSNKSIIEISLDAGYESQQAFSDAFKAAFNTTPGKIRKRLGKLNLVPKFHRIEPLNPREREDIMEVKIESKKEFFLAGYSTTTVKGFFVIPRLWSKLHKIKNKVTNRKSLDCVYALNEYNEGGGISFDYLASIDLLNKENLPSGMVIREIPPNRYVIFKFRDNPRNPVDKVMEYIYKDWFPSSTYRLNGKSRYDLVRYSEVVDSEGKADIEVLIPIED